MQSAQGAKKTVRILGYGVLLILAAPFAAVTFLPFATYKGVMKCKRRAADS